MANLSIRNLEDELVARLKRRGAEAEARAILRHTLAGEAGVDFGDDLAAGFRKLTSGRRHTRAEDLIREGRDER